MTRPFLNNLKEARLRAGLQQTEVAIIMGLKTTDRISRWEKAQSLPNVTNLFKLARIYRVLPHELYQEYYDQLSFMPQPLEERL